MTEKQKKAIAAWCKWYSAQVDAGKDYSGYEQDLFEAFYCSTEPFEEASSQEEK